MSRRETTKIQITATAISFLIIEINTLWEQVYSRDHEKIRRLVNSGDNIHVEFCRYMEHIRDQCNQSWNTLEDIKTELVAARRDRALDPIVANEVTEQSARILQDFEASDERSNVMTRRIQRCMNRIRKEEESLKLRGSFFTRFGLKLHKLMTKSPLLTLFTVAGTVTIPPVVQIARFNILVNASMGVLAATTITHMVELGRTDQRKSMLQDLAAVNCRLNALFQYLNEFRGTIRDRMVEIQHYAYRVELSQEYAWNILGDQLVDWINILIERTNSLQESIFQLEQRAADSADLVRNIIRMEHPEALGDI